MTTVRSRVREGFLEVSGPEVAAVVEVEERHREALTEAAGRGLVALLDVLCSRGLTTMPVFALVADAGDRVRVLVRGTAEVDLGNGRVVTADGREPWLDVDVEDAGEEITLVAPEPRPARGWRRPSRLRGAVAGAAALAGGPAVAEPAADDAPPPAPVAEEPEVVAPSEASVPVEDQPGDAVVEDAGVPETLDEERVDDGSAAPVADGSSPDVPEPDEDEDLDDEDDDDAEAWADWGAAPATTSAPAAEPPPGAPDAEPSGEPGTVDAGADGLAEDAGPDAPAEPDAPAVPPADLTLPPPEDGVAGAAPADRVPPSPAPTPGIIDSVPWRRAGGAPAPGVPAEAAAAPVPQAPTERFDTPPPPEPAPAPEPVREPDPEPGPDPAPPPDTAKPAWDTGTARYDTGATDAGAGAPTADVTQARGALSRSDDDLDRPVVLAVLCPAGHHSAPHAGRCRTCGREIPPQQPAPIPRPTLGVLRISTGGVVPLDRGVLLGRAPRVNEELPPDQRPHLIRVGGVDRDISRNHAEIAIEGWHVLVRDLGSTNGTTVTLPGEEPVRLRPTEDQGIEPGTVITLADEVSLTYEVDG